MRPSAVFWIATAGLLAASRLAHTTILWADEDYHLAAAIQLLHGKMLYRDLWFDKPPLGALWPLLWGAFPGWPLRFISAATAGVSCWLAFLLASRLWGAREGYAAAGVLGFFEVFYFAHATIPVEPDTLLLLPHLAAVYLAVRGRSLAAGAVAGLAFLLTPKGGFVLAAAFLFQPAGWFAMLAGFLAPNALAAAWLISQGAWADFVEQVWRWGLAYTASPPAEPAYVPLARLLGWAGFHGAMVLAAARTLGTRLEGALRWRLIAWLAISLVAAALGWRLLPRYLNQVLPPLAILAAPGLVQIWIARRASRRALALTAAVAVAAAVPLVRFGPRYSQLIAEAAFSGGEHDWADVHLDQESRAAAARIRAIARPGDTIFIWGYRPNIVVYTRLPVASRFWESQPLTGVPADRHLGESAPLDPQWAAANRHDFLNAPPAMSPDIVVDGLSRYNPALDIDTFPEMANWMRGFCLQAEEGGIAIYRRCASLP